jgi:hypothetical protein
MNFHITSFLAKHAFAAVMPAYPCLREGVALARLDELTS